MNSTRRIEHHANPLFLNRWSPRAYTGESIPQEDLLSLFEAARWAPSAFNQQPWRFIYAHRATSSWDPIFACLSEFNRSWVQRAAAVVVVTSRQQAVFPGRQEAEPNPWHAFDAGAAWLSIALQASLSGWAAHAMAGFDAQALGAAIGLPQDCQINAVVAVGRQGNKELLPAALQEREAPNARLALHEIIQEGAFKG